MDGEGQGQGLDRGGQGQRQDLGGQAPEEHHHRVPVLGSVFSVQKKTWSIIFLKIRKHFFDLFMQKYELCMGCCTEFASSVFFKIRLR